jgi:hypothetical protein
LWQLPPFLKKDLPRLDKFLGGLPAQFNNDLTARATDNARALREMSAPYAVEWKSPSREL